VLAEVLEQVGIVESIDTLVTWRRQDYLPGRKVLLEQQQALQRIAILSRTPSFVLTNGMARN
jgi:hypothetical protein